jgi:MFS family permease
MGIFGSVFGLSSVIGPFLGGLLTDQISWHWVFYVNLPLGLVALAFLLTKMPAMKSGLRAPIDWLGTILLITSVVPLLLGLTLDKSVFAWTSPLVVGLLSTAIISTAIFLFVETRAPSPILALSLFRNRTFAVVIVASFLNGGAFFGAILFLSLYLVNVIGMTATQAGTAQIPLMVAFVAGSILSSQIVARIGRYKGFIIGGFAIMLVGFFMMTQLNVHSTMFDVTWRMLLLGLGIGPALPLLNLAMQNDVPYQVIGSATANRQFFQQLGQAVGATIFGVVLTTTLTAQISQNLAPVIAELPPAVQAQFDPANVRQSAVGEGGSSQQANLAQKLTPILGAEKATLIGSQISDALKLSFSNSVTQIYSYAIWFVAAAFLLVAFLLPEKPLRKTNRPEPMPAME